MTETRTVEVPVPVDTPLPEACFADHAVTPLADLTIRSYVEWVDGVVRSLEAYRAQAARCRDLNRRRFEVGAQPAPP